MNQLTLEYLMMNGNEFVSGLIIGAVTGYVSSGGTEERLVDKPDLHKLGYATFITIIADPVTVQVARSGLGDNTTLMKAVSGDVGGILGLYAGLYIGKMTDRLINTVYVNRKSSRTDTKPHLFLV